MRIKHYLHLLSQVNWKKLWSRNVLFIELTIIFSVLAFFAGTAYGEEPKKPATRNFRDTEIYGPPRPQLSVYEEKELRRFYSTSTTTTTTTVPYKKPEKIVSTSTVPMIPYQVVLPPANNMSHNEIMAAAGIDPQYWDDAEFIIAGENADWNPCKYFGGNVDCNYQGSGAYGIPQAIGGGRKMANAGDDWRTNPVTQLRWMEMYCNGEKYPNAHYDSWAKAVAYKKANGVY